MLIIASTFFNEKNKNPNQNSQLQSQHHLPYIMAAPLIIELNQEHIELICTYHVDMFQDMFALEGKKVPSNRIEEMKLSMKNKLSTEIGEGKCKVWAVRIDNTVAAIGGLTIISSVPTPFDSSSQIGYIHSMYTVPEHRGKRYASRILQQIIRFCRDSGIVRITLNASKQGKSLYRSHGFELAENHMRLFINSQG